MPDQQELVDWTMHVSAAELCAILGPALAGNAAFVQALANSIIFCQALAASSAWKAAQTTTGPAASLPAKIAATTIAQGLSR